MCIIKANDVYTSGAEIKILNSKPCRIYFHDFRINAKNTRFDENYWMKNTRLASSTS
jgi:hypothetical protein